MDEKKEVKIDTVSINDGAANDAPANQPDQTPATTDTDEQIEKLTAQLSEITDKYLRTAAELENTRRRAALDIESATRNRAMAIAS